jgi:hypothetical protein
MAHAKSLQLCACTRRGAPVLKQLQELEWRDVEAAVRELSGYESGAVMLVPQSWPQGEHMVVLREEGEYECQVHGTRSGAVLIDPNVPRAFPAEGDWTHRAVPMETVLKAAKTYYTTGELDADLSWEETVSATRESGEQPRLLQGKALQAVVRPRSRQSKREPSRRRATRQPKPR